MGVPLGVVFPHPLSEKARGEDPSRRANRRFANRGRSLRVRPQSYCAPLPHFARVPWGEAFEYIRSRLAPPIFFGCTAGGAGDELISIVCRSRSSISIHVPTWGTTCGLRCLHIVRPISIHVPLWDTTKSSRPGRTGRDFYSRRPD